MSKCYDGLYTSTFTDQLPFGLAIVRGAYDEGYDWMYKGWWKSGQADPKEFLREWLATDFSELDRTGEPWTAENLTPIGFDFRDYILSRCWVPDNALPSWETWRLIEALRDGDPKGRDSGDGIPITREFTTHDLADDIMNAVTDGAAQGYQDAVFEALDKLGIEVPDEWEEKFY